MYIPAAFAESDLAKLHDFIEQNSFGLLVSQVDGLPFASHLPLLVERTAGPNGTLVGHMARANPQWREAGGQIGLAIFSGPHAYISPTAGRRGKGVTVVFDVPLDETALRELAATLKQRCGTGGTVKGGRIEIQGDQRERLVAELEKLGYKGKASRRLK